MSILADQRNSTSNGVQRQEFAAAGLEVAALIAIFIVAFTGRSAFGDGTKTFLTLLSVVVGVAGSGAGMFIVWRGVQFQQSRIVRFVLGGFMTFIGTYTIVHVLS